MHLSKILIIALTERIKGQEEMFMRRHLSGQDTSLPIRARLSA